MSAVIARPNSSSFPRGFDSIFRGLTFCRIFRGSLCESYSVQSWITNRKWQRKILLYLIYRNEPFHYYLLVERMMKNSFAFYE
jgi:hypothetical protein